MFLMSYGRAAARLPAAPCGKALMMVADKLLGQAAIPFVVHVKVVGGKVKVTAALALQLAHGVKVVNEQNLGFSRDIGNRGHHLFVVRGPSRSPGLQPARHRWTSLNLGGACAVVGPRR
jgi:hypothetical protein